MSEPTHRWAIKLRSRHTGQYVHLVITYETREEAEKMATDEHVCHRCNSVEVYPIAIGRLDGTLLLSERR